jgi:hypothetical protein
MVEGLRIRTILMQNVEAVQKEVDGGSGRMVRG